MISRLSRAVPKRIRGQIRSYVMERSREATGPRAADLERWFDVLERRLEEVHTELRGVSASCADLQAVTGQLTTLLSREANIPPPPPKHLQERVSGGYVADFVESGYRICRDLERDLQAVGVVLRGAVRILDFGCGAGRLARPLKVLNPDTHVFGTDIDGEAIAWLQSNYSRYGRFDVAPHRPPTSYPASSFDLILGISVFTHLPQDMESQWLDELRRIAAPGAHVVLTTHGEAHWRGLPPEIRDVVEREGFCYGGFGSNYGRRVGLPDFYQTAYHSTDYVRREWGKRFEVLAITPLGMDKHQDTVLLRRPA